MPCHAIPCACYVRQGCNHNLFSGKQKELALTVSLKKWILFCFAIWSELPLLAIKVTHQLTGPDNLPENLGKTSVLPNGYIPVRDCSAMLACLYLMTSSAQLSVLCVCVIINAVTVNKGSFV